MPTVPEPPGLWSRFIPTEVNPETASAIAAATCPEPPPGPYGTIIVKARSGKPPGFAMLDSDTLHSPARATPAKLASAAAVMRPEIGFFDLKFIFFLPMIFGLLYITFFDRGGV